MFCPFKMANPELVSHYLPKHQFDSETDWECARNNCELWNEHFGRCSLAVDAYLKGQEDYRREKEIMRKGG